MNEITNLKPHFNSNVESADLPFNIWIFSGLWILINVVGEWFLQYLFLQLLPTNSIPSYSLEQESGGVNLLLYTLLTVIVSGLIIGGGQWILLRRYFEWPVTWILVYMAGELAVTIWSDSTSPFMNSNAAFFIVPLGALIAGVLFGTAQWFVLRKEVYYAGWWIVASAFSWFTRSFLALIFYLLGIVGNTSVLWLSRNIFAEAIMVGCLVWLLSITLKKDNEVVE